MVLVLLPLGIEFDIPICTVFFLQKNKLLVIHSCFRSKRRMCEGKRRIDAYVYQKLLWWQWYCWCSGIYKTSTLKHKLNKAQGSCPVPVFPLSVCGVSLHADIIALWLLNLLCLYSGLLTVLWQVANPNQIENLVNVCILAVIQIGTNGIGLVTTCLLGRSLNRVNTSLQFTSCPSLAPLNTLLKFWFVFYSVIGSSWSWDCAGL